MDGDAYARHWLLGQKFREYGERHWLPGQKSHEYGERRCLRTGVLTTGGAVRWGPRGREVAWWRTDSWLPALAGAGQTPSALRSTKGSGPSIPGIPPASGATTRERIATALRAGPMLGLMLMSAPVTRPPRWPPPRRLRGPLIGPAPPCSVTGGRSPLRRRNWGLAGRTFTGGSTV